MAGVNKVNGVLRVQKIVASATAVLMMMAVAVLARPVELKDASCSTSDTYVYPYWSLCISPAELSTGFNYITTTLSLGLVPEYDETNATYYVRLSSSEATYVAVTESSESGTLPVNSTVYIYNSESGRALTWREEGTDEYFLIEEEVSSVTSDGARFRFVQATGISLPCPHIYSAQCQAYYLISNPDGATSSSSTSGAGLQAYVEDDVTYIKAATAGSTGDLPIVLTRSSSTTTSAMSFPTIRSVTAHE